MSSSIKKISINDGTGKIETRSFTTDASSISYGESDVNTSLDNYEERIKSLETFRNNFNAEKLATKDSKGIGSISFNEDKSFETGDKAVSLGDNNKATGDTSIAIGRDNESAGSTSVSIGEGNIVSGAGSFAEGTGNSIGSVAAAHAEGNNNQIINNGAYSHVGGNGSVTGGECAFAHGSQAKAEENNSIALGEGVVANCPNETVIGKYNDYNIFSANQFGPLFVVGNGIDDENRSNAMLITQDGKVFGSDFYAKKDDTEISVVNNFLEIERNKDNINIIKKNIVDIENKIGDTDISSIGITITDAIDKINTLVMEQEEPPLTEIVLTKAEYDALPDEKYSNGINYFIEDYFENEINDILEAKKEIKIGDTILTEQQLKKLLKLLPDE